MTTTEKIADDLGQIISRLDTNLSVLENYIPKNKGSCPPAENWEQAVMDVQMLIGIKERILAPVVPLERGPEGTCLVCGSLSQLRHINLYVIGSEGLDVCHDCEMAIMNGVREMIRIGGRSRKVGYLAAKKVAEAKQQQQQ